MDVLARQVRFYGWATQCLPGVGFSVFTVGRLKITFRVVFQVSPLLAFRYSSHVDVGWIFLGKSKIELSFHRWDVFWYDVSLSWTKSMYTPAPAIKPSFLYLTLSKDTWKFLPASSGYSVLCARAKRFYLLSAILIKAFLYRTIILSVLTFLSYQPMALSNSLLILLSPVLNSDLNA